MWLCNNASPYQHGATWAFGCFIYNQRPFAQGWVLSSTGSRALHCAASCSVSVLAVVPFLPVVARLTPSYLVFYPQLRHLLLPQTSADPVRVDFCFLPSEFPLVLQWFTLCIANVRFSNSAVPWTERSYFLSVLVPPTGSMGLMNACPMKD